MLETLSIIDNTLLQGLGYGLGVLGVALAFRVVRYPDLTPDGSFLVGSTAFASMVVAGAHWSLAVLCSMTIGAAAGAVTALLHFCFGVHRLLSGILTSMACYSIGFRILDGRSNVGLNDVTTMFSLASEIDASDTFRLRPLIWKLRKSPEEVVIKEITKWFRNLLSAEWSLRRLLAFELAGNTYNRWPHSLGDRFKRR